MAVIFAVVGGGAIVGVAKIGSYDDYSDHSDYSNYGDYSNYSDAAERRRRRMTAKEADVRQGTEEVNQYKINHINGYLHNQQLIAASGELVSVCSVKKDGDGKINYEENKKITRETKSTQQEVDEIDAAIAAIDRILEDKRQ